MGIYRSLWCIAVGGAAVCGLVAAVGSLEWGTLLGIGALAAVFGPFVAAGVHGQTRGPVPSLKYLFGAVAVAVASAIAVCGFITLFNVVALLCVGLLALCSPGSLRILLAHDPRPASPEEQTAVPPQPSPPLQTPPACSSLSDAELCWQWRISFAALLRTGSPGERLRLVQTRSALLDELAHRDPEGFTRWLNSGARAASDPARFVTGSHCSPG